MERPTSEFQRWGSGLCVFPNTEARQPWAGQFPQTPTLRQRSPQAAASSRKLAAAKDPGPWGFVPRMTLR